MSNLKQNILVSALLILGVFLHFQVLAVNLYTESFETDGEGSRYNSTTFIDCAAASDFFIRTNDNAPLNTACTSGTFGSVVGNVDGSFFWASEDIGGGVGNPAGTSGNVTSVNIGITGASGLTVSVYLANVRAGETRWEFTDFVRIQYAKDGGSFVTVGQFVGNATFGGDLQEDTNLDNAPDGALLSTTLTQYSYTIPDGGTNLQVRIEIEQDGGTEEFAFDLIEVDAATLPVTLNSFVASKSPSEVSLLWETASELNNKGFDIERSNDTDIWESLGFVQGAGTSSSGQTIKYLFRDLAPKTGPNYYRLKQIDFDGKYEYSKSVLVNWKGTDLQTLNVYPNPANSHIQYDLGIESKIQKVQIFNLQGQLILEPNTDSQSIPLKNLKLGTYFLLIKTSQESVHQLFEKRE